MSKYYSGQLAFVFGASEGIGAAVCLSLAQAGAQVVAFSRSESKLQNMINGVRGKHPSSKIEGIPLDVTSFESVQKTLSDCIKKYGTPYFVMNFAGQARPGFIDQLDMHEYRNMMELNYFGTLNVIKALSKNLMAQKKGHVVTCSSMAGFLGLFGYTGYCASKFAVIGFSEALKREWAPYGIKVSVLCPPNTKTPGLQEENKTKPAEVLATEEKATVVEPDFVAKNLMNRLPTGEFLIVPTFDGKIANYLNRLSPKIIDLFVKRKDASV